MNKKNAIVIGSGFGGLSIAIRLQAAGFQVTLLEKRDKPGGRAYVYEDKGFTFDAGPTVITAPECLEELFLKANKKMSDYVTLLPVMPFYRLIWEDGYTFDYSNNDFLTFQQIQKKNPSDGRGYQEFLKYSQAVFETGYTQLVHQPFLTFSSLIKVLPDLIRLKAHQSVYQRVSHFIQDKHLREAFSFHSLLVGGNPFNTSSIYTLIHFLERKWGVLFPQGGTGALVKGLVKLFEDLGGVLELNSPVESIVTQERAVTGVRLESGKTHESSLVVSNADIIHTYDTLLKNEPFSVSRARSLKKKKMSMSLFLIYFGTKRIFRHLAHHTVIFGPRYHALLKDIFENGILADDFSLYLHAPCRTDESLAPPGCDNFYLLSPVPHLGISSIDWTVMAPIYAQKIFNYLEKSLMPGLKESLVTYRFFTPHDFKTELNAYHGSAFSLAPILSQSAYFRAHNKDSQIKGLYFVGAGTHPGAGLPGVVNSAKATAQVIWDDLEKENNSENSTHRFWQTLHPHLFS